MLNPVTMAPKWGFYQTPYSQALQPALITHIELSGYAPTPQGWLPFSRARLNPMATHLHGWCQCPMQWIV